MIDAVAPVIPAFLTLAVRVRAEQNAARFEGRVQLQKHAGQFLAGYMKERSVGEYAIEAVIGEVESEEALLPHCETLSARHCDEARGTFQAYWGVTELDKRPEIAARPAAKVEDRQGRLPLDVLQQRRNVLADVVPVRAVPETLGLFVIVLQRPAGDVLQLVRV